MSSNNSNNNMAIAMSGKTARACDCCVRRRARWYCAADDAFLCQSCDGTVHSANPLARRHERVRLKTASFKSPHDDRHLPTWHRGLTRKPRTPRHGKNNPPSNNNKSSNNNNNNNNSMIQNPSHMVPDLGVEETLSFSSSHGEEDEQLLFCVPEYDPFLSEFCTSATTTPTLDAKNDHQFMVKLPSDLDLEEFAADVETLLGKGLDDECYGIEDLGLLDHSPNHTNINHDINNNKNININDIVIDDDDDEKEHDIVEFDKVVKEENVLGGELIKKCEIEMERDDIGFRVPFDLSFDYDFPVSCGHQHMVDGSSIVGGDGGKDDNLHDICKLEGFDDYNNDNNNNNDEEEEKGNKMVKPRQILLRLDYEAISEAWSTQGSPWMDGHRPEISPHDDSWPHCLGGHLTLFGDGQTGGGSGGNRGGAGGGGDGGREARVTRYREKRRTRLFSKKIRYEVRKLNAEKRPRMKGRFVKRSSFAPTTTAFPLLSK